MWPRLSCNVWSKSTVKFALTATSQPDSWVCVLRQPCHFNWQIPHGQCLIEFCVYFVDVITIEKTGEHFRLIYDVKGRFTIHRISAEEAKVSKSDQLASKLWLHVSVFQRILFIVFFHLQYKLCKVKKVQLGAKNVPFLVTHDGRTIRYPDPIIKANDTIQLDIATTKITDHIKFESGK